MKIPERLWEVKIDAEDLKMAMKDMVANLKLMTIKSPDPRQIWNDL
jgi:hypothetical protein